MFSSYFQMVQHTIIWICCLGPVVVWARWFGAKCAHLMVDLVVIVSIFGTMDCICGTKGLLKKLCLCSICTDFSLLPTQCNVLPTCMAFILHQALTIIWR